MTDGIADLAEAFATAEAEIGEATPTAEPVASPAPAPEAEAVDEQAEAVPDEQPEVVETTDASDDEDLQALVDSIAEADESADDASPVDATPVEEFLASDSFWSTEVEVTTSDGPQSVSVQEAVDGYMRQRDYTQKTQVLANERAEISDAVDFHQAFNEAPLDFARALAVRAGLLSEDAQPIKNIEAAQILSPEEMEAEVSRRVEERFESDPRVLEAKVATAQAEVNSVFDAIESDRGVTIGAEARNTIIQEAVRQGTGDLEMVFDAQMYRQQLQRKRVGEKQRTAPSRPTKTGTAAAEAPQPSPVVSDIDEAMDRAFAELGA